MERSTIQPEGTTIHWPLLVATVLSVAAVVVTVFMYVSFQGKLRDVNAQIVALAKANTQDQSQVTSLGNSVTTLNNLVAAQNNPNKTVDIASQPTLFSLNEATLTDPTLQNRFKSHIYSNGVLAFEMLDDSGAWRPTFWWQPYPTAEGSGSQSLHIGSELFYNVPANASSIDGSAKCNYFDEYRTAGTPSQPLVGPGHVDGGVGWLAYCDNTGSGGTGELFLGTQANSNSLSFLTDCASCSNTPYANVALKRMELTGGGAVTHVNISNSTLDIYQTSTSPGFVYHDQSGNAALTISTAGGGTPVIGTDNGNNLLIQPQGALTLIPTQGIQMDSPLIVGSQSFDIPDNNIPGVPGTYALSPSKPLIYVGCLNPDGCHLVMDNTSASPGQLVVIVNTSPNRISVDNVPGVTDLNGPFSTGQYGNISLINIGGQWVEMSRTSL